MARRFWILFATVAILIPMILFTSGCGGDDGQDRDRDDNDPDGDVDSAIDGDTEDLPMDGDQTSTDGDDPVTDGDEPIETDGDDIIVSDEREEEINDFVDDCGEMEVPDEEPTEMIEEWEEDVGDEHCTYRKFTETRRFDNFVAFQPNSATLWPGNVVQGADAMEGLLTPVPVELAPIIFSLSLENIAESPVGNMDDPSLSSFRAERNRILRGGVTGATPASISFDITQVYSESQISIALGASVEWPGGNDITGNFNFTSGDLQTKILVDFTQAYYTIDVDTPGQPADVFADDVTVEDLEGLLSAENPPLYVQSITFGRRVIFSIETNESLTAIQAAIEATYQSVVSGTGEVEATLKDKINQSRISAVVLGGSAGDASGLVSGFEGLINYIMRGGDYGPDSPGAPIAYKLAYLNNSVTRMAFTTEYTEKICYKNKADLKVAFNGLQWVRGGDEGIGDSNWEIFGELILTTPTADNAVSGNCAGGEDILLWSTIASWPDGDPQPTPSDPVEVPMDDEESWAPAGEVSVTVSDVYIGPDARFCIWGALWEDDGIWGAADELGYGYIEPAPKFEDGWVGPHTVNFVSDDTKLEIRADFEAFVD